MEEAGIPVVDDSPSVATFNDVEYDVAPPAAPMELYGQSESTESESMKESLEKMFFLAINPDNYVELFRSAQGTTRELLGDERYEVVAMYALPVSTILLWTLFVYLFAYFRGRASKESVLEGEMMKTQAKVFKLEKDINTYSSRIKRGKINQRKWNTRIWLFLIVIELLMVLYFYFIHQTSFLPSIHPNLHYVPLLIFPILMLVFKKFVTTIYGASVRRAEKRIKGCFDSYEPLREKYKKLMEENNHSQVMKSIHNIDVIEKSFKQKGRKPVVAPTAQQNRPQSQPKPQVIPPASQMRHQTPQQRPNRVPDNGNTAPVRYTKHAPPMPASPYVPQEQRNGANSGGLFGAAVGLISGSTDTEMLICEFCNAPNGTQPKHELKQFKCCKCQKYNGIKKLSKSQEKNEPEEPTDDDVAKNEAKKDK